MNLGFIGFGEVSFEISNGLKTEGLQGIIAFDPMQHDAKYGSLVRERAATASVTLLETPGAVIAAADLIISAVPGSKALQAAESILGDLKENICGRIHLITHDQTKNCGAHGSDRRSFCRWRAHGQPAAAAP